MKTLAERISSDDALAVGRLARRISGALLSGSYRYDSGEWESSDEESGNVPDRLPFDSSGGTHRPYFETLFVSPAQAANFARIAQDIRRLRRVEDPMIYEPVLVGSFEDAIVATIMNGKIEAVVIYDGIPVPSQHDVPLVRDFLATYHQLDTSSLAPQEVGVTLARAIKRIRPELDLYLLTDRQVEKMAGDPAASMIRRVFYEVEELTEVHLNILEGVGDRMATPHFDNLKKYAARPIGTFHALPIARGKSIMKSNWIRDMGEFYGQNLFLAESSSTAGGLDSMLEPTGNIKIAQEKFARAVGADHVYFVTNGTSTSNKMVYQAVCKPGDIVIADRNCHKSHHYGMVLSGAQPRLCRSVPDDRVLDVRRGAAAHGQAGAAQSEDRGTARSRQDDYADQLHVRRPRVQHAPRDGRMPGDQAGCHFSVGRGVVRFCALVTVPASAHRPGRSRCAGRVAHDSRGVVGVGEAGQRTRRGSRPE